MHGGHTYYRQGRLLLSRKAATKVVRARSDQGLRGTDRDRREETGNRALTSAITFLSMMTFHNYSLAKPDSCFLRESLALQDYHMISS